LPTSANEYNSRYRADAGGPAPSQVGTDGGWTAVASGHAHTIALRDDGSLWSWGGGGGIGRTTVGSSITNVQIGTESNWRTVDAGRDFTIALRDDGTIWGWGWNEGGVLGLGSPGDRTEPTQIGSDTNWWKLDAGSSTMVAIRTDGTLWAWGRHKSAGPTQIGTETNWIAASAGADSQSVYYDGIHFMALRRDGTLWGWGQNQYGQLGIGVTAPTGELLNSPIQVGVDSDWRAVSAGWFHTLAIKGDGSLWAWGQGGPGALGLGGGIQATNRPVQVGQDTNWVAVYAGRFESRALKADGTLWAWGNIGTPPNANSITTNQPVQVGIETDWRHVTTDDNHFYREGEGPVWPWKSIASGWRHFVGIRHDGTLWASGDNFVGQLGQPTFWAPAPIVGRDWGSSLQRP